VPLVAGRTLIGHIRSPPERISTWPVLLDRLREEARPLDAGWQRVLRS